MKARLLRSTGILVASAAAVLGFQSAAHAQGPTVVYVAKPYPDTVAPVPALTTTTGSCTNPQAFTIQQGVDLVEPGGRVIVCRGTYAESVNINKKLTLQGLSGAVVEAAGQSYGIGVGADHVTVTGMTVRNAGVGLSNCGQGPTSPVCAGIQTATLNGPPSIGNYLNISGNVVTGNGFGLNIASTHGSRIAGNKANGNGVGINVVDDFGAPVSNNTIVGNQANNNTNGCGIALASHLGVGVIGNLVQNNTANGNGTTAGGAGILLATPASPAKVMNNQLVGNHVSGNGHAGIEVHFHPGGVNASGNSIVGNYVGHNNSLGDFNDAHSTGIYVGSNSPLSIVVRNNHISNDYFGIFKAGPHVTVVRSGNTYTSVTHALGTSSTFA